MEVWTDGRMDGWSDEMTDETNETKGIQCSGEGRAWACAGATHHVEAVRPRIVPITSYAWTARQTNGRTDGMRDARMWSYGGMGRRSGGLNGRTGRRAGRQGVGDCDGGR